LQLGILRNALDSGLKDTSIDDQISVLLAIRGIQLFASEKLWFKMNAFIGNKSLRLSFLFKACVPLWNSIDFKQFEGTEPMILTLRKAVTPEVFVPPYAALLYLRGIK
jgi:hypothetical protein